VSGGLDSAVLLRDVLRSFRSVQPLYVRTGMRWERVEIRYLRRFLASVRTPRLKPLALLDVPMADLYGKHWSTTGRRPPGYTAGDESVYLPGRNIALLSKAATFCALGRIPILVCGVLANNPFSDATPGFFRAMERALGRGLGAPIRILAPFRELSKDQVIRSGRRLRLDRTFSCSSPRGGRHCGDCAKCAERVQAFRRSGVPDPTVYAGGPGAAASASDRISRRIPLRDRARTRRVAPKKATRAR
jgi:7-cyano-7-deazaguanine synthase